MCTMEVWFKTNTSCVWINLIFLETGCTINICLKYCWMNSTTILSSFRYHFSNRPIILPSFLFSEDVDVVQIQSKSVIIKGSGDPDLCLTILQSFLRSAQSTMCYPKPCTIGNTYQPAVSSQAFYAISAFTYAPKKLKAVENTKQLDIELLNSTAFQYCTKVFIFLLRILFLCQW